MVLNEMQLAEAMEQARQQGLPDDWTLSLDDNGRKRWSSSGSKPRSFAYLQRALDYVNGKTKASTTSSNSNTANAKATNNNKNKTQKKRSSSKALRQPADSNDSKKKAKKNSSSPIKNDFNAGQSNNNSNKSQQSLSQSKYSVNIDPETSLDIHYDYKDASTSTSTNSGQGHGSHGSHGGHGHIHKHNRHTGTVHWDPHSKQGKKVGHRIRVWDFDNHLWKKGRVVRYDPVTHMHKIIFFHDVAGAGNDGNDGNDGDNDNDSHSDDDTNDEEQWLFLHQQNYQLGGRFVWALVKGFAWWPAQVLHCHYANSHPILSKSSSTGKRNSHGNSNSNAPSTASTATGKQKDLTTQPVRDGYLLVEFFDSDEVASIKDSPEYIRDFHQGEIDAVIKKNKKKRNASAIQTCAFEEIATRDVRNDAARFYAERAFDCANSNLGHVDNSANGLLGKRVEIFRNDVNYPVGEHLIGHIRGYSRNSRKYLVAYDPPPYNSKLYPASWENLTTQRYKLLEDHDKDCNGDGSGGNSSGSGKGKRGKQYVPNDFDLFPFLFGHEESDGSSIGNRCRGCVAECTGMPDPNNDSRDEDHDHVQNHPVILQCSTCKGMHHPGCLDPPISIKAAETILKSDEPWTCNKCIRCMGCRELEIAFGIRPVATPPASLFLPRNTTLHLCNACAPMYDKEMFCPICAHVWDDARYQHVQKQLKGQGQGQRHGKGQKKNDAHALLGKKRAAASDLPEGDYVTKPVPVSSDGGGAFSASVSIGTGTGDVDMEGQDGDDIGNASFRWKLSTDIQDSWYYPENNVWGYNEETMLSCEKCNLWVHARCAEISESEYEKTSQGDHPVYSREYLCRKCCKEKCLWLMKLLREEDTMYLFAEPVTDQMAHNYSDIIKNPMDLRTMSERALIGHYRNYAWLRESFELMVYNALLFNPPFSQYWNEAKRFYAVCRKTIFAKEGKGAPASKYKDMIKERFELAEKMVQAEKDRVKTDKTAEKKDLVAGDQVLSVVLGPLVNAPDPPSCVATAVVRMTPMDAFYSTWLECCFSCGSSGALDTMLYCVDCGEAYHSFCASAPIHSMNDAAVEGWRCPNCKLCEISGEVTTDELQLVYCEMCDRAFTIDLISPPLEKAPSGLLICGQCVDCTKCKNVCDRGEVSRKYWSRDPDLCLPCGGCDGLDIVCLKNAKCTTCKKMSRDTDGLPQCTTCDAYIHKECDKTLGGANLLGSAEEIETKYVCPRCRKKVAKARRRKLEAAKVLKAKAPKKDDALKETKAKASRKVDKAKGTVPSLSIKRYVPSKHLTEEEQKDEALQVALTDAQSRGLPAGWTCFYGAGNRKRWRSPPPIGRVFDSVPKALQYVERVKTGVQIEKVKRKKDPTKTTRKKKDKTTIPKFEWFQLRLDLEPDWFNRENGYDDSTSLMSDAEVMLKVLEARTDVSMSVLYDSDSDLFKNAPHVQCLPKYIIARAGRFVRFVKRLRYRSSKNTSRGMMNNRSAQVVVCKMASAFVHATCIMFKVDIQSTMTAHSWESVQSYVVPVHDATGTVDIDLEPNKANAIGSPPGSPPKHQYESNHYYHGHNSTPRQNPPAEMDNYSSDPAMFGLRVSQLKKASSSIDETMAQIQYNQLDISGQGVDHVPLALHESKSVHIQDTEMTPAMDYASTQLFHGAAQMHTPAPSQIDAPRQAPASHQSNYNPIPSDMHTSTESANYVSTTHPYSLPDKSENEFNILDALMALSSPSRPSISIIGNSEPSILANEKALASSIRSNDGDPKFQFYNDHVQRNPDSNSFSYPSSSGQLIPSLPPKPPADLSLSASNDASERLFADKVKRDGQVANCMLLSSRPDIERQIDAKDSAATLQIDKMKECASTDPCTFNDDQQVSLSKANASGVDDTSASKNMEREKNEPLTKDTISHNATADIPRTTNEVALSGVVNKAHTSHTVSSVELKKNYSPNGAALCSTAETPSALSYNIDATKMSMDVVEISSQVLISALPVSNAEISPVQESIDQGPGTEKAPVEEHASHINITATDAESKDIGAISPVPDSTEQGPGTEEVPVEEHTSHINIAATDAESKDIGAISPVQDSIDQGPGTEKAPVKEQASHINIAATDAESKDIGAISPVPDSTEQGTGTEEIPVEEQASHINIAATDAESKYIGAISPVPDCIEEGTGTEEVPVEEHATVTNAESKDNGALSIEQGTGTEEVHVEDHASHIHISATNAESKGLMVDGTVDSAITGFAGIDQKLNTDIPDPESEIVHSGNPTISPKEDIPGTLDMSIKVETTEPKASSAHRENAGGSGNANGIKNAASCTEGNGDVLESVAKVKPIRLPWFTHEFTKVRPVKGWAPFSDDTDASSDENRWFDSRTCCLCNASGDDDAGVKPKDAVCIDKYEKTHGSGRLLALPGGGWIHTGCAIWSSEVWETHGGVLNGVAKAKTRGMKLKCFGCGQTGATLGCHRSVCNANFHFSCAKACGVIFTSSRKLFCAAHKQYAKDEIVDDFSEQMKILRVADENIESDDNLCYRSGSLIVHSLGKIEEDCDGFHSKSYITPPGFASTRIFWSFVQPKTRTVYMMRIVRSPSNTAIYIVTAADAPTETFQSNSATKLYTDIMKRVWDLNKCYFSHGDLSSVFPMTRSKNNRNAFCLNGPQFFGFGIEFVRRALEARASAVSCAVPLTTFSTPYQFCFEKPTQQSVMDLQRRRAAIKAEKSLENVSGCARTEGSSAFDKSKGSGRITRALVRKADEDPSASSALAKGANVTKGDGESTREFESIQAKYREMKSVPMEERLAAKRSHIHGWGLFAKKDYPKNSMIAEYMGEAICQPIADKREKKYEILGMGSCYMFRLDLHAIVDATNIGCMARFMNHCCAANAYANVISANTAKGLEKKIVVFANQDIKTGDEITYDYKFPVEDGSLRCTCGAPKCIGRMN